MTSLIISLDIEGCRMVGQIATSPTTTREEEDTLKKIGVRVTEEIQKHFAEIGLNSRLVVKDRPEAPNANP